MRRYSHGAGYDHPVFRFDEIVPGGLDITVSYQLIDAPGCLRALLRNEGNIEVSLKVAALELAPDQIDLVNFCIKMLARTVRIASFIRLEVKGVMGSILREGVSMV